MILGVERLGAARMQEFDVAMLQARAQHALPAEAVEPRLGARRARRRTFGFSQPSQSSMALPPSSSVSAMKPSRPAPFGLARGVPVALEAEIVGEAVGVEARGQFHTEHRPVRSPSRLPQTGVDGDRLLGDHPAVVGREEQHHRGRSRRRAAPALDRLAGYARWSIEACVLNQSCLLPLGDHRAGFYRVDADIVDAETAAECAGQADNAGLGGGVGRACSRRRRARRWTRS